MTTNSLIEAKELFYKKYYNSALEEFIKAKDNFSAGVCSLLLNDKTKAQSYWKKGAKNSPACEFGLCLLSLIELDTSKLPSFFQVRAFLEVFINLFLENDLLEYAENLISCCDALYTKNPETYKFIARALFANGYFDLAITFCKRTLKLFYADPEALLIMAQCQFLKGELGEALDSVNKTLYIADNYFPALCFKDIVKTEIEKKRKVNS